MREDSENIKADCVSTVVFTLHQIKKAGVFFLGHPVNVGPADEKSRKFESSLGVETRCLSSSTAENFQ